MLNERTTNKNLINFMKMKKLLEEANETSDKLSSSDIPFVVFLVSVFVTRGPFFYDISHWSLPTWTPSLWVANRRTLNIQLSSLNSWNLVLRELLCNFLFSILRSSWNLQITYILSLIPLPFIWIYLIFINVFAYSRY